MEVCIGYDTGGCYVEWYRERDEHVTRWYGTRAACEAWVSSGTLPRGLRWVPIGEERIADAATATGMYDAD